MKIFMNLLAALILGLFLVACDGTNTASNPGDNASLKFSSEELADTILFSSKVLQRNVQDGFVLRFDASRVQEIRLLSNQNHTTLRGDYDWTIVNDKLQISYPSSVTCTSTKKKADNLELTITASCDGGTPQNAIVEGTLSKTISFNETNLSGNKVTIDLDADGNQEIIDFKADGSFLLTRRKNSTDVSSENGTYKLSIYTNTVRLNYSTSQEYSLLVLLQGSLSSGVLLDLRYKNSDDSLIQVRIYTVNANNSWQVDDFYNSITVDNETS